MQSSVQASQTTAMSNPKPALGTKPVLAPKPFSLQKNTSIRAIHAPKTVTTTSRTTSGKPLARSGPRTTVPTPAKTVTTSDSKPNSLSAPRKDKPKEIIASQRGVDTLDSRVGKSDSVPQAAPPKEIPKTAAIPKDGAVQTKSQTTADSVTNLEQKDGEKKDETQTLVVPMPEKPSRDISPAPKPTYRWGSTRNRLSVELTSKFESGGPPLLPQPGITTSTASTKDDTKKPEPSNPEQTQTTTGPTDGTSDECGLSEDHGGGGSIQRRISLLFDSASRPDVTVKREEPEIINGTGGVKARIKSWALETSFEVPKSEKKPQPVSRGRPKR